jgi:hypothetical protein
MLVQKCDELGSERVDVGVKCQLHKTPGRSAECGRTSIVN